LWLLYHQRAEPLEAPPNEITLLVVPLSSVLKCVYSRITHDDWGSWKRWKKRCSWHDL